MTPKTSMKNGRANCCSGALLGEMVDQRTGQFTRVTAETAVATFTKAVGHARTGTGFGTLSPDEATLTEST